MDDGISFGSYPKTVTSDDGTAWLTHLFVLDVDRHSVGDWSLVLIADHEGTPGEIERIMTSRSDRKTPMTVQLEGDRATFQTVFVDSAQSAPTTRRTGAVTVTCR